jgi:hypothetical protein
MCTLTSTAIRVQGTSKIYDEAWRHVPVAFDSSLHIDRVPFLAETSEKPMEVALESRDDAGKVALVIAA